MIFLGRLSIMVRVENSIKAVDILDGIQSQKDGQYMLLLIFITE